MMGNMMIEHPWLERGFRLFFALGSAYAILVIFAWLAYLFGGWPIPVGWSPLHWHSHEMLYGWPSAAIAGFLLTAVPNWTGRPPLAGLPLLALTLLWLLGRVFWLSAGYWPPGVVAVIDLAFPLALTLKISTTLLRHGRARNYPVVLVLVALLAGNALMHLGFITGRSVWLDTGEQLALNLLTLLMAIIAGRITPMFTRNWLQQQGRVHGLPIGSVWLDRLALLALALIIVLDLAATPSHWMTGIVLAAAVANSIRLLLWRGWHCVRNPLLWVLHLGYAWLVLSLFARAAQGLGWLEGTHLWQHSLGMGAMATLILGVMSRVALGHTGRTLKAPPLAVASYGLITIAVVLRLLAAGGLTDYRWSLSLSALAWIMAFGCFLAGYLPILVAARQR